MKMNSVLIRLSAVMLLGATLSGVWIWHSRLGHTPEQLFQQGLLAVQNEDWPAVRQAAHELKRDPKFGNEQRLLQAIYLLKSGAPAAAVKEFQRLKAVGDVREPALLYAGEALYRLDHLLDAEVMFAMLVTEHPEHAEAHRWLAGIAHELGDMNRARHELEILISLKPTDYRPHMLLGQIYVDLEQYASAVEAYSRAYALHPPDSVLAEMLPEFALAQIQIREYAAALETLAQAPRSALVAAAEAECLWSLDDEAGARQKLADALERDPEQTHALYLLGQIELGADHPAEAIEPLRRVMEIDPTHHESQHQLAQALRLTGQISDANAVAKQADRIIKLKRELATQYLESIKRPEDAEIRERVAALCDDLGRQQLAVIFRKAAAVCRQRMAAQPALPESVQSPWIP